MPLIDFTTSQPRPKPLLKRFRVVFAVAVLLGASALGSTLAANINLNGDSNVEFGQGDLTTTTCDNSILVTAISTFINAENAGSHKFSGLTLSDVDTTDDAGASQGCAGKIFTIKA